MRLRKFPVTAGSGREYEVEVVRRYAGLGNMGLRFRIYKRESYVSLFGRIKQRRTLMQSDNYWEHQVTNVVERAKALVRRVEEETMSGIEREQSYAEFERWDGRIDANE
nr:hypothetical protein [Paenibacillus xylanexedens]